MEEKFMKLKKGLLLLLLMGLTLGLLGACGVFNGEEEVAEEIEEVIDEVEEIAEEIEEEIEEEEQRDTSDIAGNLNYVIEIDIEGYGIITLELDGTYAPETVANFVGLARDGFYDGLTFHRIIEGFMMQGGCPIGNGSGSSGTQITGEFIDNGINNPGRHYRGAISMARSQDYNSASSQFFIVHEDAFFLDSGYAVFGHVLTGLDVVDSIVTNAIVVDGNGSVMPENQPVINTIRVIQ
jgi:peptidyl-prolyl cis-trans isomerase B (cyclophilin B)